MALTSFSRPSARILAQLKPCKCLSVVGLACHSGGDHVAHVPCRKLPLHHRGRLARLTPERAGPRAGAGGRLAGGTTRVRPDRLVARQRDRHDRRRRPRGHGHRRRTGHQGHPFDHNRVAGELLLRRALRRPLDDQGRARRLQDPRGELHPRSAGHARPRREARARRSDRGRQRHRPRPRSCRPRRAPARACCAPSRSRTSRSSAAAPMELLRIMPGVVPLDQDQLQTVGFGRAATTPPGYTVNGVRGTNNVVTLDGSMLMDIGSNNGVIINPNPDMVESVKMLTSNYAAEYGTAGVQVSADLEGRQQRVPRQRLRLQPPHELAANDRSNSIAGIEKPPSQFLYPGANLSGPLIKDKPFFFGAFEYQRQRVDMGTRFGVVPTHGPAQWRLLRVRERAGDNLLQPRQVLIPGGYPGAGTPRPRQQPRPLHRPHGPDPHEPVPACPTTSTRATGTTTRVTSCGPWTAGRACCGSTTTSATAPRRTCAWPTPSETNDQPRGLWWDPGPYALPTPVRGDNDGMSGALSVVSVISPTMTNEVLLSYSRLRLTTTSRTPRGWTPQLRLPEHGGLLRPAGPLHSPKLRRLG